MNVCRPMSGDGAWVGSDTRFGASRMNQGSVTSSDFRACARTPGRASAAN